MTKRPLALVAALLVVAGATRATQEVRQAPPTFRSVADLVQVDVSVLDSRRAPVRDLTAADFTLFENGQPRVVEAFTAIDLPDRVTTPTDAAWTRDVPSDVATNRTGIDEGRIVVILMDRTIPVGPPATTARKVALAAVEALGPGDLGALVSTSGGVPVNLTSNRERLIRAINQRDWSTGSSAESAEIVDGLAASAGLTDLSSPLIDGRCLCGLCVIQTITNVAASLESMPRRRKSMFFVGSNLILQHGQMPTPPGSPIEPEIGCGIKLEDARKQMWSALDRSGITIHSVDPSGLQVVGPTGQASSTIRGIGGRGAFQTAVQENLQNQGSLGVLPARTGGRVVINTNGPEERVPEIVRESASYYVLGFRPSEPLVPGQAREIEVRVNRRDVKVHARREYTVPAPPSASATAEAALGAAIRSTLPVADAQISMSVATFAKGTGPNSVAAIALDLSSIAASIDASNPSPAVAVAVAAYDLRGRPINSVEGRVMLPVAAANINRRVETLVRLELPPGELELRAAVAVEGTGTAASVFAPVSVPPFATVPLSLSHIALAAAADTTTVPRERLIDVIPIVPTTKRVFGTAETVVAFMRVYQGVGLTDPVQPVVLTASIVDGLGAVRMRQALEFKPAEFGDRRTADARFVIPAGRFGAGGYLFTVEGKRGERVAGRAVRFSVR